MNGPTSGVGPSDGIARSSGWHPSDLPVVYDALPVGLCVISPDLRFLSINQHFTRLTGRPADEDIGRTLGEVTPSVAAQLEPQLSRALRGERVADLELRGTLAGTICEGCIFLASLEPLRGADGRVEAVLCSAIDITERKLAEAALKAREAELARILEATSDSVLALDRNWRIAFLNSRAGMQIAAGCDVLGQVLWDLFPEAVNGPFWHGYHQTMAGRIPCLTDAYYPALGRHFRAESHPSDGGGIIIIFRDVTEERAAEAKLRESKELEQLAMEAGRVGVYRRDIASGLIHCSPATRVLHGVAPGRGPFPQEDWMAVILPEDRERIRAEIDTTLRNRQPRRSFEYRVWRADDNSVRFIEGRTQYEYDPEGHPVRAFGVMIDVTERKLAEARLRESEDHYRHTVELSPLVSWTADQQGAVLEVSTRWQNLTGIPLSEGVAGRWEDTIHPEDHPGVLEAWNCSVRAGEALDVDYRLRGPDGGYVWMRARAAPRRGAGGEIVRWYGTLEDINDRKLAELALQQSEAFTRSVVESSIDCIKVLDIEGRLLFMNAAGLRLNEIHDFSLVAGRSWSSLLPDAMAFEARRAIEAARDGQSARFAGFCPVGAAPKWWDVIVSPISDADGAFIRILSISRDITEKHSAEQQIVKLAHQDPLTDLANRRLFKQELERALARMVQGEQVALHYIDLDHFKRVNDTLGHPVGDALLQQAAQRLRGCVRASDFVARLGGDEFAVLQTGVHSLEDAVGLARRVISAFDLPYELDGRQVSTGASIGIALAPIHASSPDDLVRDADTALYRAKSEGRGKFRFFEPVMAAALRQSEDLRTGLRSAMEQHQFELFFQPLVALHSGRVTCFEALARWRHPVQGLIPPSEFIPIAEESGTIVKLGKWALHMACREAACWPGRIRVAVNLSPVQFSDPGLLESVKEALSKSGLAAERLELEITESVLMQDSEANLAILRDLRELGVRIALDDFGTGFSSLGYLLRFPFDKIKIDRSFIIELPASEQSKAIVGAVASIGRSLGIAIAAEGVESADQLRVIRDKGCTEVQGYYFSNPLPAAEVVTLLDSWHFRFPVVDGQQSA